MRVTLTIPGIPTPWARAGRKGGIMFTPGKQRAAMADVRLFASRAMEGRPLLTGPLEMVIIFFYPWPKSISAKKRATLDAQWKDTRPDLSNLQKLVEDALNAVVYCDDAQLAHVHVSKMFSSTPRVEIEIQSLIGENAA